jgi:hypothetical protein
MTYLIGYLIISIILMVVFIELNKKVLYKQYLDLEKEYKREPSNGWFNFYILTHFIKAPFLCPMIFLLILGNGGKIIE